MLRVTALCVGNSPGTGEFPAHIWPVTRQTLQFDDVIMPWTVHMGHLLFLLCNDSFQNMLFRFTNVTLVALTGINVRNAFYFARRLHPFHWNPIIWWISVTCIKKINYSNRSSKMAFGRRLISKSIMQRLFSYPNWHCSQGFIKSNFECNLVFPGHIVT